MLTHCRAESLLFARRHGFTPSRELRYSALDLRPAPPMPEPPPGVRLLPAAEVAPRRIHRADPESSRDEPGDVPTDVLGYHHWQHEVWDNPGLDRQASTVATHRGRGLARLTEQAALHRAAAAGVCTAYTSNDEANAPMPAVNAGLGYRPVDSRWSCRRRLS